MNTSASRFVELRGVKRDAEWHSRDFMGFRVGESYRPRPVTHGTPAAARRQAAQPAYRMPNRETGRENVGS